MSLSEERWPDVVNDAGGTYVMSSASKMNNAQNQAAKPPTTINLTEENAAAVSESNKTTIPKFKGGFDSKGFVIYADEVATLAAASRKPNKDNVSGSDKQAELKPKSSSKPLSATRVLYNRGPFYGALRYPEGMTPEHFQFITWMYIVTFLHPDQITLLLNNVFRTSFQSAEVILMIEQLPHDYEELEHCHYRFQVPYHTEVWWDPWEVGVEESYLRMSDQLGQCAVPPGIFHGIDDIGSAEWSRFIGALGDGGAQLLRRAELKGAGPVDYSPGLTFADLVRSTIGRSLLKNWFLVSLLAVASLFAEAELRDSQSNNFLRALGFAFMGPIWLRRKLIEPLFMTIKFDDVTLARTQPDFGSRYVSLLDVPAYAIHQSHKYSPLLGNALTIALQSFIVAAALVAIRPLTPWLAQRLGLVTSPWGRWLLPAGSLTFSARSASARSMISSILSSSSMTDSRIWSSDPVTSRRIDPRSANVFVRLSRRVYKMAIALACFAVDACWVLGALSVAWLGMELVNEKLTRRYGT